MLTREAVTEFLADTGMSQRELARRANVDSNSLSAWRNQNTDKYYTTLVSKVSNYIINEHEKWGY